MHIMKKTVSLVLAVLLLSMLFGISDVYSEGTGSLTIKYTRKDNGQGVAGVEMSALKVADLSSGSYTLTELFLASGVLVNDLSTADKKNKAAAALFSFASQHGISGVKAETDAHGNAYFSGLTHGIYLVAQTRAVSGFKTISPYLVYIPGKTIGGSPIYNVLSNVKTERDNGGSGGGGEKTFSVSVTKIWDDSDNADGIRPKSVSVSLLRSGKKYKTATLSAENGWKYTFSGLSGTENTYAVEEDVVAGYTASYTGNASSGFVITNRHKAQNPPTSDGESVLVIKKWVDDSNEKGLRPSSVTVQLIKDGTVYKTAQLNSSNNWNYRFNNLPNAKYTVIEIPAEGYYTSYSRADGNVYVITNTLGESKDEPPLEPVDPSTVTISVKKVWDDKDNADKARPNQITVQLIKDGKTFRSAKLSSQNGWQYEFSDVPKNAWYSIYEETDGKYTVSYSGSAADGYVITNTYPAEDPKNEQPEPTNPALTNIPVYKMWNDGENAAGKRPQSITVHLIKDGSLYRSLPLSADGGWQGVFEDVPADGVYSITEDAVLGYTAHYTAGSVFVVTNTYTGETNPGISPDPFVPSTDEITSSASDSFYEETVSIPQTGSLNWPVPVLAGLGIAFLLFGLAFLPENRRKRS